jgi:hypothetical protein
MEKKIKFVFLFIMTLIILSDCSNKPISTKIVYITSENDIEIKENPDIKSKTINTLTFGEPIRLIEVKGDWNKVLWDEKQYWISAKFTDTSPDDKEKYSNLVKRIQNAKKGDVIKIVQGKYNIDENNRVILDGKEDLIFRKADSSNKVEFISKSNKFNIFSIKNCKNISLEGINFQQDPEQIDDNRHDLYSHDCISIEESIGITITECSIFGYGYYGIVIKGNNSGKISITKNVFHNCSDGGVYEDNPDGIEMENIIKDNIEWSNYIDPLFELTGEYEGTKIEDSIYGMTIMRNDNKLDFNLWNEGELDGASIINGSIEELNFRDEETFTFYYFSVKKNNLIIYMCIEKNKNTNELSVISNIAEDAIFSFKDFESLDTFHRKN